MAAMRSANASDDGDLRNGKIRETTLEIIKNHVVNVSKLLEGMDSPASIGKQLGLAVWKAMKEKMPAEHPDGMSAADRLKWVKQRYNEMLPEAFGDDKEFDVLLHVLLRLKYKSLQEFQMPDYENNPNELNGLRAVANECTEAVIKLLGTTKLHSLPVFYQSMLLQSPPNALRTEKAVRGFFRDHYKYSDRPESKHIEADYILTTMFAGDLDDDSSSRPRSVEEHEAKPDPTSDNRAYVPLADIS
eukprot:815764_1